MSTPFHLLPAPSALAWANTPESAIGPVWSPWPRPSVATLSRSNVWPAPTVYKITWWAPPSIIHLVPADPVVEGGSVKPTVFGRLRQRASATWQRLRS